MMPNSLATRPPRVDYVGGLLSVVTLAGVVFGAIEGPGRGWDDAVTLTAFGVGVVGLTLWVAWGFIADEPLLDPRLFRNRAFSTGVLSIALQFFVFFGYIFVIVQYLQLVLDYSPLQAGLALIPMAIVLGGLSRRVPHLMERVSRRPLAIAGLLLMGVGTVVLAQLGADSSYWLRAGRHPSRSVRAWRSPPRPRPPTSSPLFPRTSRAWPRRSTTRPARSVAPSASPSSAACSTSSTGPAWQIGHQRLLPTPSWSERSSRWAAALHVAAAWATTARDSPTRPAPPSPEAPRTRSTWPPACCAWPRCSSELFIPGKSEPESVEAGHDESAAPVEAVPR